MTDREAIELMAFFFAVAAACQVWFWLEGKASEKTENLTREEYQSAARQSQHRMLGVLSVALVAWALIRIALAICGV